MSKDLKEWAVEILIDKIRGLEGTEMTGREFYHAILGEDLANGSYSCDTEKARKWVMEYWIDLQIFVDSELKCCGEIDFNPLDAEKLELIILNDYCENLVMVDQLLNKRWHKKTDWTQERIDVICEFLQAEIA
ncbi:hypothetical protein [Anaerovibrio sp. RM50]|uniref:hypothetical protein n=1 Tax=Anaerovibrio sp. RM50 TaxID=1200557 RepID=UPI000480963D|nr:hypothetical protein [Anaerovibrio sp. RM50]